MTPREHKRWLGKVVRGPGCWLWVASIDRWGYGQLSVGSVRDGSARIAMAHRLSYEHHVGPIPARLLVLHSCDVPACVNPEHLRVGTVRDNIDDKISRGRTFGLSGEANPAAKLTATDVREIRARMAAGETAAIVSVAFGISTSAVYRIRARQVWREVTP